MARNVIGTLNVDNIGIRIDIQFLLLDGLLDGVFGVEDMVEFFELLVSLAAIINKCR